MVLNCQDVLLNRVKDHGDRLPFVRHKHPDNSDAHVHYKEQFIVFIMLVVLASI